MKYIAIIPARGGSKRFPNKNIHLLGGKPLIAHSIEYAKKCNLISEVYVSSDDSQILKIAEEYGAIPILRPPEISGDTEPTYTALQHVSGIIGEYDHMVLLQSTNPLRPAGLIEDALKLINESNSDSLFTVTPSHRKLGKIINNVYLPWNYSFGQRSQDMDLLYYENGLLYISRKELIEKGRIMGDKCFPMVVNHIFGTIDIDTKEDFDLAAYYYDKFYQNSK